MNWFVFRQHRKQFLIFGVLLASLAALLIPTGVHYWQAYQHLRSTCAPNPNSPSCNWAYTPFMSQIYGFLKIAVTLATFALPILVGVFIGAPLIAREYEEGTDRLVWTQSISRRRWLTTKLVVALGFALLYGALLACLVTWWSHPLNSLGENRFVQGHFETQGLMPAVYSVFFTAIGFMTGAWLRKSLVAFAVTLGVFVVCLVGFAQWIRPHYMPPVHLISQLGPTSQGLPNGAWMLNDGITDNHGNGFRAFSPENMPTKCKLLTEDTQVPDNSRAAHVKASGGDPVDDCLNSAGYRRITKYQPPDRYWDFQRIEAGIYLSLTALAIGATYWLVLKRDA